ACRFVGTPGVGPQAHFYTIDPAECDAVRDDPRWRYEGQDFQASGLGAPGRCADAQRPVYRAYNDGFATNTSNHRYITSPRLYDSMLKSCWIGEGPVFCVP